jgi:hypothetical protein
MRIEHYKRAISFTNMTIGEPAKLVRRAEPVNDFDAICKNLGSARGFGYVRAYMSTQDFNLKKDHTVAIWSFESADELYMLGPEIRSVCNGSGARAVVSALVDVAIIDSYMRATHQSSSVFGSAVLKAMRAASDKELCLYINQNKI